MLNNFLKDYFTFSRRERSGIIVLMAIMLILVIANIIVPLVMDYQEYNYSDYETELLNFENSVKSGEGKKESEDKVRRLFMFNPNTVNESELTELGFDRRVIRNIIKYREHGGCFYRKEDLLKIYGIDTPGYKRLAPFIYMETDESRKVSAEESKNDNTVNVHKPININRADLSLLTDSLGVDREMSERIIKYRYLLGGFSDKNQFDEIYGITWGQSVYLTENVFIDSSLIRKININNANEQVLSRHPYINDYYARAIVKYRKFSGEIIKINELLINNILPEEVYMQVSSYLTVK
jgi:competence protein ComEA